MGYIKAENVLPENVLKLVQDYIDGEFLYIPRKKGNKKSWGEENGTKKSLEIRNLEIFLKYSAGKKISELAVSYCLSKKSIERIVYSQKNVVK